MSKKIEKTEKNEYPKTFILTSGKEVVLTELAKGKHSVKAQEITRGDQYKFSYALACQLCKIDGQFLTMEEILELPIVDASELVLIAMTGSLDAEEMGND